MSAVVGIDLFSAKPARVAPGFGFVFIADRHQIHLCKAQTWIEHFGRVSTGADHTNPDHPFFLLLEIIAPVNIDAFDSRHELNHEAVLIFENDNITDIEYIYAKIFISENNIIA